jgi:hypothetical protein
MHFTVIHRIFSTVIAAMCNKPDSLNRMSVIQMGGFFCSQSTFSGDQKMSLFAFLQMHLRNVK